MLNFPAKLMVKSPFPPWDLHVEGLGCNPGSIPVIFDGEPCSEPFPKNGSLSSIRVYPIDTPVLQCYFYGVDSCLGVNQAENGLTRCKSPPWWLNPSWNGSSSSMLLGCERSISWRFRAFSIWNFLKKTEATTLHDSYKCYKSGIDRYTH